ncbi:hypothetical protein GUITHDRAFT_104693 [Guillardia theta CCMP2712]|uniref:RRM domain-containing protein n=1 Tax=Guillardia theta (strain CCMP2712) TaxID=905079 RepID=L1JNS6_GUITC|nr:hypothetical protein GUITHDRAFT_104693 [Guillardia theta CCMP2712]EKX49728.1 hypothetical protein GUITHDRAFT_104693 [Guillardia theta CCMP2712]|eukprot:XP_005836708.1 hypothetical protein GUITHDRAFT_104693 [Guillardia theta CCMP2712]
MVRWYSFGADGLDPVENEGYHSLETNSVVAALESCIQTAKSKLEALKLREDLESLLSPEQIDRLKMRIEDASDKGNTLLHILDSPSRVANSIECISQYQTMKSRVDAPVTETERDVGRMLKQWRRTAIVMGTWHSIRAQWEQRSDSLQQLCHGAVRDPLADKEGCVVYLGGIYGFNEKQLRERLELFGQVIRLQMRQFYAFAQFASPAMAAAAVKWSSGRISGRKGEELMGSGR